MPFLLLSGIKDLEGKVIVDELRQEVISTNCKAEPAHCLCLAWSADGQVHLTTQQLLHLRLSPNPVDYSYSLLSLMSHDDSPANMRGSMKCKYKHLNYVMDNFLHCVLFPWQTLFAGYTDNQIRVWQVTIGTR